MLSIILGDGKSSRLYKSLIEKVDEPYFYQIESCYYQLKGGDNFFIEANFDALKIDNALDEIKKHLDMLSEKIESWELEKAKKRIKVNFAHDSETVCDIADSIGFWATTYDDISLAQKYFSLLDEIDCAYLIEIAKKYLSKKSFVVSLLLPEGEKNEVI